MANGRPASVTTKSFFADIRQSALTSEQWLYATWFNFLVGYRRTVAGPVWLLFGPTVFIATLGLLFAQINAAATELFIPFLGIGLVFWTLFQGFISGGSTIFVRRRSQIMVANANLVQVVLLDVFHVLLQFAHQIVIIAVLLILFSIPLTPISLISLFGLILLIANGVWVVTVMGIVGARYRDLNEIANALLRIAFLATPIIWMPGGGDRAAVVTGFMLFNPFYHFLEIVRAPLLGQVPALISWIVVGTITLVGFAMAQFVYNRYAKQVPLWL
ncbi:MAG: ABC transporter permease [Pseudomonadota bacterium]